MPESFFLELIKQGGGYVVAAGVFWMYRQDSQQWAVKQSETAAAFMAFGERTATALTQVAETLRLQTEASQRIEAAVTRSSMCPMTGINADALRDASGGLRRKIAEVLEQRVD